MDYSPQGSSVHVFFPARIPEWVAIPFSRASSGDLPDPGMEPTSPVSPALQVGSYITEPQGEPKLSLLIGDFFFFLVYFFHLFLLVGG